MAAVLVSISTTETGTSVQGAINNAKRSISHNAFASSRMTKMKAVFAFIQNIVTAVDRLNHVKKWAAGIARIVSRIARVLHIDSRL